MSPLLRYILTLCALPTTIFGLDLLTYPSIPLPLSNLRNNRAASDPRALGIADFDGRGSSFDGSFLPTGSWNYDGITYSLPEAWGAAPDNVITNGQVLVMNESTAVHEMHLLYSGDISGGREFVANFQLNFVDNSTQRIQLYAKNWYRWPLLNNGAIKTPFNYILNGTQKNFNSSQIYQWSTAVPSHSKLESITLPANVSTSTRRLHLFALSLTPSVQLDAEGGRISTNATSVDEVDPASFLSIRRTRFSSRWEKIDGQRAQAVEVTIANLEPTGNTSTSYIFSAPHEIRITGPGITTVRPGRFYRLGPGDQLHVDVFVLNLNESPVSDTATVTVIHSENNSIIGTSSSWPISPLITQWTNDAEVLNMHESPAWWNGAKFGIFIHWGVYSVPAWAPSNTYAEWYQTSLSTNPGPSNPTWAHHLATYGNATVYDDFIANFTASQFNASEWLDLFDAAGAKYFVLVTKHHDGYALFDTGNTTHRNSVHLEPKRDFVDELLSTAKREKPEMHRGTYYSLPEWFNPDYAKYGFGSWPGGLTRNAFNSSMIDPYTGYLNISDYLQDLQLPHMLALATKYDTEIMWCDIGGPNKTLDFAPQFFNHAWEQGRQVTINNRCGAVPDFDTPEYATFGSIQTRNWESSEGMDPHSYGLNSATSASQYKNATSIVRTLVDIASKNGNYLLDIGPSGDGSIIAPMADNLREAGSWLKHSGECVYETKYWYQGSQDTVTVPNILPSRFLTTPTTFCIIALARPMGGQLVVNKPLPFLRLEDEIFLLSPGVNKAHGMGLSWSVSGGSLTVNVSEEELDLVKHAWAFQVVLGGV